MQPHANCIITYYSLNFAEDYEKWGQSLPGTREHLFQKQLSHAVITNKYKTSWEWAEYMWYDFAQAKIWSSNAPPRRNPIEVHPTAQSGWKFFWIGN